MEKLTYSEKEVEEFSNAVQFFGNAVLTGTKGQIQPCIDLLNTYAQKIIDEPDFLQIMEAAQNFDFGGQFQ